MRDNLRWQLSRMFACLPAIRWLLAALEKDEGLVVAWQRCQNADWMHWLVNKWVVGAICTCDASDDPNCPSGTLYRLSLEETRAKYADDIACIAYYTGL